ncbi:MAG: ATP-binding protein [Prevotella sp.]|nr:ATP-binding protein [Prevotella sp.]
MKQYSITLPNDVQAVPQLAEFVDQVCEEAGFDMATIMKLNLAIEEAVVNVMNYAYPAGTAGNVTIEAVLQPASAASASGVSVSAASVSGVSVSAASVSGVSVPGGFPAGVVGSLTFIISDSGVAFDPTVKPEVDTTLSAEERNIGGLGIHLIRQIMDSVSYERTDNRNILTLVKNL